MGTTATKDEIKVLGREGCTYYGVEVEYDRSKMLLGPAHMDACELSNGEMIDIEGLSREFKKSNEGKLVSGDTKINISGATIDKGVMHVPRTSQVQMSKVV